MSFQGFLHGNSSFFRVFREKQRMGVEPPRKIQKCSPGDMLEKNG
jgi:hypothetical protein